jgi:hypothetical protein
VSVIGAERRSESRYPYFSSVEFVSPSEKGEEILVGTVINISNSGLCLYSYVPLRENGEITIRGAFPFRHRTYSVIWMKKLLDDFFMVGLKQKN